MLNVCFDSSAAGMLAMTMPGHAEHVVCLAFALSAGDIAAPLEEGGPRWQLLHRWFSFSAAHQKDSDTILSSHWHHCTEDLARLCARAAEEPVRIYVDQTPDAACGLLFVAHLLSEAGCPAVSAVPLPFYQERPDGTLERGLTGRTCRPFPRRPASLSFDAAHALRPVAAAASGTCTSADCTEWPRHQRRGRLL